MTRCLLVDEDGAERQAVGTLLGAYGFELAETANADAALQHCRRHQPDIVVTGDRLGGMTASEFVKRVRRTANNGRKQPVVLVYTDRADTEEIGRAIIEGAAEYLLKPFDRELLEFKLRQVGLL